MTNKWKDGRPPVGEECEITVLGTDGLFRDCKILYIDSMSVVFSSSAASSMPKYLSDVKFRPIKTPDEIERERVVGFAFKTLTIDNSDLAYKICQDLYDAGLLTDKKVKYLTRKEFEKIFEDNISAMGFNVNILKVYDEIFGADND